MRVPGNSRLTPRTEAERKRVEAHPLVRETIRAEKEIRRRYPDKRYWLVAVREQVALYGLSHGLVFADRLGYGVRSRLGLLDEQTCHRTASGGCICQHAPCHAGLHRCACGREWTKEECRPRGRGPGRKMLA